MQTDSVGTTVREVFGPHLVIGTGGAPAPPGTDDLYFFDTDAVGSVRQITTMTPGQRWWKDYQPFGLETGGNASTGGTADEIGFAGKEIDPSGMNYAGARNYQSQTGRFTIVDPGHVGGDIFNPQSWDGYAYALNNPLRFMDPLGTKPCQITLTGADATAAGVADGGTVHGECVTPEPSWRDWWSRNFFGLLDAFTFATPLQAPGLGEANQPLPDRSPDLGVSIAAAVAMPRALSAEGTTLAKMMQSEAGIAELLGGGGKVIAGAGSRVAIRDVARLVSQYGGKAADWSRFPAQRQGCRHTLTEINIVTGVVVELKSKIPGF